MKRHHLHILLACILSGLLLLSSIHVAQAAEQIEQDTIPFQPTNWTGSLSVPQFDPSLGALTSVKVTLIGAIQGTAKYESTDAKAATITLNLSANVQIQRPNNQGLLQTSPVVSKVENAAPFDGNIDFDGPSGSTFPNLQGQATDEKTLTDAADLALFTGAGNITLPARATGTSNGSGSGNLIAQFNVDAQAIFRVVYTYEPADVTPRIRLQKTVYAGHNNGAGCAGQELVSGLLNDPITYCFDIRNTGDTYLDDITLVDPDLGIDLSDLTLLSGNPNQPLAPGASLVYYFEDTLTQDLDNTAATEGNPVEGNGDDIPGLNNVTDSDDASVRIRINASVTVCKYDTNESRLSGWTINLNGPDDQSGQTGEDGCVTFTVALPGSYTISEEQQAGWQQVDPPNNGNYTVDIQDGDEEGPFNFMNEREATIRVCKVDDKTDQPISGWEINLNGPENKSRVTNENGCLTFQITTPGNYTITETLPPGWQQIFPIDPPYFSVPEVTPGENYGPYTFRNRTDTGITIIKQANPEDGTDFQFTSQFDPDGFTLDDAAIDDGDAFINTVVYTTVLPGAYWITETVPAGWLLADVDCSDDDSTFDGTRLTINLSPTENLSCTFTNAQLGRIIGVKQTIPATSTQSFDFQATSENLATPIAFSLQHGERYTIENVPAGIPYTLTENTPTEWVLTDATCSNGQSPVGVTLSASETVTCTFTNQGKGKLTVYKVVEGGSAAPGDFTINVSGANPLPPSFSGSNTGVTVLLDPGVYSVTEQLVPGYTAAYSADCTGQMAVGENKVCTITNRGLPPGGFTLVKVVINDDGGTAGPNDFGISVGGAPVTSGVAISLTAGIPFAINENSVAGYQFVSMTGDPQCPSQLGGTVTVTTGEQVTCTITNDDLPSTLVQIGDFVFDDLNKNGIQDDGPGSGLPGVTVRLYRGDGSFTGQTRVTDADGRYEFDNLPPGDYFVEFEEPPGYDFTQPKSGDNDETDSDADPNNGRTSKITLNPGDSNDRIDGGFVRAPELEVEKSVNENPVQPGGILTYTIRYTNTGLAAAVGVVVTETVPNFTTFLPDRSTPGWSCTNNEVKAGTKCIFTVGALAINASGTLLFVVQVDKPLRVPEDGLIIFNSALIAEKDKPGPPNKGDRPKKINPPEPTGLELTEEPKAFDHLIFLPLVAGEE
jgi:uncharacterized repeat protein (TIGR01451 family)